MSTVVASSKSQLSPGFPAAAAAFGLTSEVAVAWLERIMAALEPEGARIWIDDGAGPRPLEEFGPSWSSLELDPDERRRYRALIATVLEAGAGKIAEPRSSSHDALEGGNPTEYTLLACPLSVDGRNVAVVETWYGDEFRRSDQDGAAEQLAKLCATFRDSLSERRLDAARRETEFAARLAGRLEVDGLAREIVSGLCALVRADRAVMCRLVHGKWRIIAAADAEGLVSTVDDERAILRAADVRSRHTEPRVVSGVREIEPIATPPDEVVAGRPAARATNTPGTGGAESADSVAADADADVAHGGVADGHTADGHIADGRGAEPASSETEAGDPAGMPENTPADASGLVMSASAAEPEGLIGRPASLSYAEHTDVKTAAFLPLVRRTDTQAVQTEFVLIAEWYRREAIDRSVEQLLYAAVPSAERSLEAARRCEALPFRRLSFGWARMKLRSPLRGVPVVLVILGAVAAAGLLTLLIPWSHTLAAPGTLRPVVRSGVFAATDGVVDEIVVRAGSEVKKGELLVRMSNPELEVESADCRKRLAEAEQELRSTERRYNEDRLTDADARARLPGQITVLRRRVEGLRSELAILDVKTRGLSVVSPIDGRVVTWDLDRSLVRRPVRRGELLLHVADPNQGWEAEIRLPQRRFGELSTARRELRPELDAEISPTSEPDLAFAGRVIRVDGRADVRSPDEGSVVLVAAEVEVGPWASKQDGAEVRARIHCGRRSLGYVLFRDAVAWLHATLFYLLPF